MHKKTQTEWENEMALKILAFTQSELYQDLRFFHSALCALHPKADTSVQTFATDGICLNYSAEQILRVFKNNPRFLSRAYLHTVLHCIFSHLWITVGKDPNLWNLSCDIVVEYTIDHMEQPSTRRILTWLRSQLYQKLDEKQSYISASVLYRMLSQLNNDMILSLQTEFYTDDHRYWPAHHSSVPIPQNVQQQWSKLAHQAKLQQEQYGAESTDSRQQLVSRVKAERSRRNYRDFLRKFSVLREELHADPDEYDLNFYTYGLRIYGNMPLIESVETREIHKIREFVIVLDTSDSTSGQLVKNFLRETYQILHQREYFFSSCKIRILQCDDQVRSDQEICDPNQFEQFLTQFTILGGGGTNFCPAFSYVNKLVEQHVFQHLGGLLYFTDGQGIYPKKRPSYQTVFLFLNDYDESKLPPWAMRLQLEPEEFDSVQIRQGGIYEYQTGKRGN